MKLVVIDLGGLPALAVVQPGCSSAVVVPESVLSRSQDPLIAAFDHPACWPELSRLAEADLDLSSAEIVGLEDAKIHSPVRRPGKIICLASNYRSHMLEAGISRRGHDPWFFMKPSTSVTGSGSDIVLPFESAPVDWEVELCLVIGRRCRKVRAADAMSYVGGMTVGNDISLRQIDQMSSEDNWDTFFTWLQGKWHDTFTPLGPWVVTTEEMHQYLPARMSLTVNRQERQLGSTDEMIFGIAETISSISSITRLDIGDVIMTGTPSGVGVTHMEFLHPGDEVEATIDGIGTLRNRVIAAEKTQR